MGGAADQAETGLFERPSCKESRRLTIETMSLCALYLRYTRTETTLSRETKFSGAYEERGILIYSVDHEQDWQPSRLIHTLLSVHNCTSLCAA